eukprot:g20482.t1
MLADMSCPASFPEQIVARATQKKAKIYGGVDFSRAFAKVRLSIAFRRWCAMTVGSRPFLACGGPIGLANLPAVFSMITYPAFNILRHQTDDGLAAAALLVKGLRNGTIKSPLDVCRDMKIGLVERMKE